ncbi:MAG: hypothetical protein LC623_09930, partial [Halobacteriales archaeon]|nr:hypothetical protein [Halobacteriales archaeon]
MTDAHPLHPPHPGHIPLPEEAPPRQPPPRVVRAFPLVGACIAGLVLAALLEIYLGQRSQFLPALISVGTLYT